MRIFVDKRWTLSLLLGILAVSSVFGQQEVAAVPGGSRPIVPEASLIVDWSGVFRGGSAHRPVLRGLLSFGFSLDLERAVGLHGGTLHASYALQRGDNGSDVAGDLQGYSNIDAEDFNHLSEAWYEQRLLGGDLRIKGGLLDANTDFAFVRAGGQFVNSSAGYSPTIFPLPTYPDPEPGLVLSFAPSAYLSLSLGVFSSPNSHSAIERSRQSFSIAEIDVRWPSFGQFKRGRAVLGLWKDSAKIEQLDGLLRRGSSDAYLIIEQVLWSVPGLAGDGERILGVFAQWGGGDGLSHEIGRHLALGVSMAGLFQARTEDNAGLMVTRVHRASLGPAHPRGEESVIELFYGWRIGRRLVVKPDLQLISHPRGVLPRGTTLVGTLRVEYSF